MTDAAARHGTLVDAMRREPFAADDLTRAGGPSLSALARRLPAGFDPGAAERDAAWAEALATQAEAPAAEEAVAPFLDAAALKRLARDVGDNIGATREQWISLAERLVASDGLVIEGPEDRATALLAGLRGSPAPSAREALINWGRAARRWLLNAGVQA